MKVKKWKPQEEKYNMSRRNKKLWGVPGTFLYDSGLQVDFLSLSSEEFDVFQQNYFSLFSLPPPPILWT